MFMTDRLALYPRCCTFANFVNAVKPIENFKFLDKLDSFISDSVYM